jgi:hypothetical protein
MKFKILLQNHYAIRLWFFQVFPNIPAKFFRFAPMEKGADAPFSTSRLFLGQFRYSQLSPAASASDYQGKGMKAVGQSPPVLDFLLTR